MQHGLDPLVGGPNGTFVEALQAMSTARNEKQMEGQIPIAKRIEWLENEIAKYKTDLRTTEADRAIAQMLDEGRETELMHPYFGEPTDPVRVYAGRLERDESKRDRLRSDVEQRWTRPENTSALMACLERERIVAEHFIGDPELAGAREAAIAHIDQVLHEWKGEHGEVAAMVSIVTNAKDLRDGVEQGRMNARDVRDRWDRIRREKANIPLAERRPDEVVTSITPGLLSAPDIAKLIGLPRKSVTTFLNRYAGKYPFSRIENPERRRGDAKYLYRTADLRPALEQWMNQYKQRLKRD